MTPLRLRQYRAFHIVIQTGSVTRAAETLSISQPAVTKLLQSLEIEIGIRLFDRTRRRLVATGDALRLHREVEALLLAAHGVERFANQIRTSAVGELRIAALPLLGIAFMPHLIAAFGRSYPGVRIALTVSGSQQVLSQVLAGQADLGFMHPMAQDQHISRETLPLLPGVIVLPPGHHLARRSHLVPADLRQENFISLGRENRVRSMIDDLFAAHDVPRHLQIETNYCHCACAFVAGGLGVSLVDGLTAATAGPGVIVRTIHPTVEFSVEAVAPISGAASPLVERFVDMARSRLAEARGSRKGSSAQAAQLAPADD